tara:strand:- start:778 stop:1068 length:291 start_codon:yes stop_codon:yes gene_type:complete
MSKNNCNNLKNVSFDDNIVTHQFEETIDEQFFNVIKDRYEDIKSRGGDCIVYDYDGKKVILRNAKIWFSNDGNYVKPKDYDICEFCSSIVNFFRKF